MKKPFIFILAAVLVLGTLVSHAWAAQAINNSEPNIIARLIKGITKFFFPHSPADVYYYNNDNLWNNANFSIDFSTTTSTTTKPSVTVSPNANSLNTYNYNNYNTSTNFNVSPQAQFPSNTSTGFNLQAPTTNYYYFNPNTSTGFNIQPQTQLPSTYNFGGVQNLTPQIAPQTTTPNIWTQMWSGIKDFLGISPKPSAPEINIAPQQNIIKYPETGIPGFGGQWPQGGSEPTPKQGECVISQFTTDKDTYSYNDNLTITLKVNCQPDAQGKMPELGKVQLYFTSDSKAIKETPLTNQFSEWKINYKISELLDDKKLEQSFAKAKKDSIIKYLKIVIFDTKGTKLDDYSIRITIKKLGTEEPLRDAKCSPSVEILNQQKEYFRGDTVSIKFTPNCPKEYKIKGYDIHFVIKNNEIELIKQSTTDQIDFVIDDNLISKIEKYFSSNISNGKATVYLGFWVHVATPDKDAIASAPNKTILVNVSKESKKEIGYLTIKTEPTGASVFIKKITETNFPEKPLGITPLEKVELEPEDYNYKITKTGYQDATGKFTITKDQIQTLTLTLKIIEQKKEEPKENPAFTAADRPNKGCKVKIMSPINKSAISAKENLKVSISFICATSSQGAYKAQIYLGSYLDAYKQVKNITFSQREGELGPKVIEFSYPLAGIVNAFKSDPRGTNLFAEITEVGEATFTDKVSLYLEETTKQETRVGDITFEANPTEINAGEAFTVKWEAPGYTACEASAHPIIKDWQGYLYDRPGGKLLISGERKIQIPYNDVKNTFLRQGIFATNLYLRCITHDLNGKEISQSKSVTITFKDNLVDAEVDICKKNPCTFTINTTKQIDVNYKDNKPVNSGDLSIKVVGKGNLSAFQKTFARIKIDNIIIQDITIPDSGTRVFTISNLWSKLSNQTKTNIENTLKTYNSAKVNATLEVWSIFDEKQAKTNKEVNCNWLLTTQDIVFTKKADGEEQGKGEAWIKLTADKTEVKKHRFVNFSWTSKGMEEGSCEFVQPGGWRLVELLAKDTIMWVVDDSGTYFLRCISAQDGSTVESNKIYITVVDDSTKPRVPKSGSEIFTLSVNNNKPLAGEQISFTAKMKQINTDPDIKLFCVLHYWNPVQEKGGDQKSMSLTGFSMSDSRWKEFSIPLTVTQTIIPTTYFQIICETNDPDYKYFSNTITVNAREKAESTCNNPEKVKNKRYQLSDGKWCANINNKDYGPYDEVYLITWSLYNNNWGFEFMKDNKLGTNINGIEYPCYDNSKFQAWVNQGKANCQKANPLKNIYTNIKLSGSTDIADQNELFSLRVSSAGTNPPLDAKCGLWLSDSGANQAGKWWNGKSDLSFNELKQLLDKTGWRKNSDLQEYFQIRCADNDTGYYSNTVSISLPQFKNKPSYQIQIIGAGYYTARINDALNLLKKKAPTYYDRITKYVKYIKLAPDEKKCGMCTYPNTDTCSKQPTIYICQPYIERLYATTDKYYNDYIYDIASSFIHEATHLKLFQDYLWEHPGIDCYDVPYDVYGNRQGETRCLLAEYDVLKQIGAPQKYLDWVYREVIDSEWWEE